MIYRRLSMLALLALSGCVTNGNAASSQGQNIQIVKDSATLNGCREIGQVDAGSLMGGAFTSVGYQNTISELKQKAAERGGTHVLLVNMSSGYAGSNALGVVYKCGP